MKILVIGGTRFIGKAVAAHASSNGHEVVLFNRGQAQPKSPYETVNGDVDRLCEYKTALRQLNADVVIHCIAYTEQHAMDTADVFGESKTRLIVLSSQDCYEAFFQLNRGRDIAELPMAEDSPTCRTKYYWRDVPNAKTNPDYDKNLLTACALAVHREGRLRTGVLRLPMVFGPEDFQFRHRHGKIIRRIFDRQPRLVLGAVEQSSLFTFGFIDNVAAAIVHASEVSVTDGKVFNIGEAKSRSLHRWAELYAEAADIEFEFKVLPDALVEQDTLAINIPPRLLQFDTQAFRMETGFSEPVPLNEQIRRTLSWGLEHSNALGPKPDYEGESRISESYAGYISGALKEGT